MIEASKQRLLKIGIVLVVLGSMIAILGFSMSRSNRETLHEMGHYKWYRTIYVDPEYLIDSFFID
ncbi:hypothetical protein ACYSNO_07185 [Enterococcus sp. LJL98]